MMDNRNECMLCHGSTVKNGKSKTGKQRYHCKSCKKTFQTEYFYKACYHKTNQWIASLTNESCGIRSIARLLTVSISTVTRKIKKIGKSAIRPFPILQGKEYEVDEMRTYIGKKSRLYWVVYALRRDNREVIDFKVGKRNSKTLQRVLDTVHLSEPKKVQTDRLNLYKNLIPNALHCTSQYNINHIERKNLSVRTHLKRLARKTICFSRSKEMLEACLRIYFWSNSETRLETRAVRTAVESSSLQSHLAEARI
jgi:insertion element IS1 protein InsB